MSKNLKDLESVGPATLFDLKALGITSIEELAKCEAHQLYSRLCKKTGHRHDPCVEDVFAAAIAQARNPRISKEKRKWWYWSRIRKRNEKSSK